MRTSVHALLTSEERSVMEVSRPTLVAYTHNHTHCSVHYIMYMYVYIYSADQIQGITRLRFAPCYECV